MDICKQGIKYPMFIQQGTNFNISYLRIFLFDSFLRNEIICSFRVYFLVTNEVYIRIFAVSRLIFNKYLGIPIFELEINNLLRSTQIPNLIFRKLRNLNLLTLPLPKPLKPSKLLLNPLQDTTLQIFPFNLQQILRQSLPNQHKINRWLIALQIFLHLKHKFSKANLELRLDVEIYWILFGFCSEMECGLDVFIEMGFLVIFVIYCCLVLYERTVFLFVYLDDHVQGEMANTQSFFYLTNCVIIEQKKLFIVHENKFLLCIITLSIVCNVINVPFMF